jgi:hypothetical protein
MERECLETRTDLEILSAWATDPAKRTDLFDQLLVFACANAFQNIAENESRLDNIKRWSQLRTNFSDFLSNYPEKVRDARQRVLRHMPDPSNWPDGFVEYAMLKISKPSTKAESRLLKNLTAEQVEICVAGKRIEELAKAAQTCINNRFNPHYSVDLPSGHQNDIAMLRLVRRYQWHEKSVELATNGVRRDLFTKKKDGTLRLVLGDGFTKQDAIEQAYIRRMKAMDYDWYPDCWFTYITMGRPAGEDHMSHLFNSGVASKILSEGLGPQEVAAALGNKTHRKRHYTALNKEVQPAGQLQSSSSSAGQSCTPTLQSASSAMQLTEEINIDRLTITLLEKELTLAESFGGSESMVLELRQTLFATITACRQKVQALQRDVVRKAANASSFATPSPVSTSSTRMRSSSSTTAEV